jgi:two-component system sensor histidine kinase BaeS
VPVLLFAAGVDGLLHPGARGLGIAAVIALAVGALALAGALDGVEARGWSTVAVILGLGCLVRSSPWVEVPLGLLGAGSLVAAVLAASGRSLFDARWTALALRGLDLGLLGAFTPGWLWRAFRAVATLRGRLMWSWLFATLLVWILAVLLASADPIFASLFQLNTDDLLLHVLLLTAGGLAAAWLMLRGLARTADEEPTVRAPLAASDVVLGLAGITALFAVFTVTQLVAAAGAGRSTLVEQDITYSDYARSGYFQLMGVVGVVLVLLPWCRATASASAAGVRRWIGGLSAAVILLTGGILGVAVLRLNLYDDAYGLTGLRLASLAGAAFMAVLLMLLAAHMAGVGAQRAWFPGAALLALVVSGAGFAILNPDATVAAYNLHRESRVALDREYLHSLSSDATPALAAALGHDYCPDLPQDWRLWTVADSQARAVC